MTRTTLIVAALLAGCASTSKYDPTIWNHQWSKAGASQQDFDKDNHECEVEKQQRTSYDDIKIKNARDLDNDIENSFRKMGNPGHVSEGSLTLRKAFSEKQEKYWPECMATRGWKEVGKKVAGQRSPDLYNDVHSYKP